MDIMKKELEQAVREHINKLQIIKDKGLMLNQKAESLLALLIRCLQFIDYCKFEFGEDITKR